MIEAIEIFGLWNFVGFVTIIALHQWRWWPPTALFGWVCIVVAGPLTWLAIAMLWMASRLDP